MFQLNEYNDFFCRPKEFVECEDPVDHKGNKTAKEETGFGCVKVRSICVTKFFYPFAMFVQLR